MALTKSLIDVQFTQGVNQKIDSKSQVLGSLSELNNRIFTKVGAIDKRKGYEALTTETLTTPSTLINYKDELLSIANNQLYSLISGSWNSIGVVSNLSSNFDNIINNSEEQTNIDSASNSELELFCWEDSTGVRYSVRDVTTGSFSSSNTLLSASGSNPKAVAVANNLFIVYGDGSDLKITQIGGTTSTIGTSTTYNGVYTLTTLNNRIYVAYKSTTANQVVLIELRASGAQNATSTITATVDDVMGLYAHTDGLLYLGFKESANLVNILSFNTNLGVVDAITALDSTSGLDITNIVIGSESSDTVRAFYTIPNASTHLYSVKTNTFDGSAGTASTFLKSVGVVTQVFTVGTTSYLGVLHESELQSTVFIVDYSGNVVSKIQPGTAGTHSALWSPVSVYNSRFSVNVKGPLQSVSGVLFSRLGIGQVTVSSLDIIDSTRFRDNLVIASGILSIYDSAQVVEQGFHLFPENISLGQSASGGSMSNGTYQVAVVFTWTDNEGNIHRSAPSVAESITVSGGGASQKITVTVPTLHLTQKTDVRIEVFRTENAGSIFYKATPTNSPTLNDTTVDTLTIDLTVDDSSLVGNELLYTTGGVLDNISPASTNICETHNDRVFIARGSSVFYSKSSNNPVNFNEGLEIKVDPRGGDITRLESLDANLVIFKRDNIYVSTGSPANDLGQNSTITDPELISTDVGCIGFSVLGPEGIYFESAKGIYLLTRGLQVVYIGANVEDSTLDIPLTSAVLVDDVNEIRFSTADNILVYNYYFKQWSVFPNLNVKSATNFNGYTYLSTSGATNKESGFLDNGSTVSSSITTGWIRIGSFQGFQRVYRLLVTGDLRDRHKIRITTYTDYTDTPVDVRIFDTSEFFDNNYGDDVYGDMEWYGGQDNGLYQFLVHLSQQKCQAIKVKIEDIYDNSVASTGRGFTLSSLTLQIGTKRGVNKLPISKKQ